MAAIFQTTFSRAFSSMKIVVFWLNFSLKYIRKGPIDNNPVIIGSGSGLLPDGTNSLKLC